MKKQSDAIKRYCDRFKATELLQQGHQPMTIIPHMEIVSDCTVYRWAHFWNHYQAAKDEQKSGAA